MASSRLIGKDSAHRERTKRSVRGRNGCASLRACVMGVDAAFTSAKVIGATSPQEKENRVMFAYGGGAGGGGGLGATGKPSCPLLPSLPGLPSGPVRARAAHRSGFRLGFIGGKRNGVLGFDRCDREYASQQNKRALGLMDEASSTPYDSCGLDERTSQCSLSRRVPACGIMYDDVCPRAGNSDFETQTCLGGRQCQACRPCRRCRACHPCHRCRPDGTGARTALFVVFFFFLFFYF